MCAYILYTVHIPYTVYIYIFTTYTYHIYMYIHIRIPIDFIHQANPPCLGSRCSVVKCNAWATSCAMVGKIGKGQNGKKIWGDVGQGQLLRVSILGGSWDHPRICKWLRTMVIVSPLNGGCCSPSKCPNSMAYYKWGWSDHHLRPSREIPWENRPNDLGVGIKVAICLEFLKIRNKQKKQNYGHKKLIVLKETLS